MPAGCRKSLPANPAAPFRAPSTRRSARPARRGIANCTTPSRPAAQVVKMPETATPAVGSPPPDHRAHQHCGHGSTTWPWRCGAAATVQFTAAATGTAQGHQGASGGRPAILRTVHPANAQPCHRNGPRCGERWVANEHPCQQRREQRGPTDMVTSTLATGISTSATMKAVNIAPSTHPRSTAPSHGAWANTALPCTGRMTSSASSAKAAPEGHPKPPRMLQVARDHTGDGPHQGSRPPSAPRHGNV